MIMINILFILYNNKIVNQERAKKGLSTRSTTVRRLTVGVSSTATNGSHRKVPPPGARTHLVAEENESEHNHHNKKTLI